ncbi:hypothetical protein PVAND_000218 [Polypedilum vanderplanki]|uniref:CD109 antigen-like protein n=1 Tax=Polypedilum vanderplanki TaxID=319348 RepID=A0A9J6BJP0_POLVA|nr:hypothetical protein PVAND_000218 [Polypedilum vanderplanki]
MNFVALSTQLRYSLQSGEIIHTKFSVITPRNIRRYRPFKVFVQAYHPEDSFNVNITIKSGNLDDQFIMTKTVSLSTTHDKIDFEFDTSNLPKVFRNPIIIISSGIYMEERELTYLCKENTFFIQTSKGIYQPSEKVQFRVFSIDSEGNSFNPTYTVDLQIIDPRRNEIIKFQNVTFEKGKYEKDFLLSNKPILGTWTLIIEFSHSDSKFPVTINAEYTFGESVNGIATVSFNYENSPKTNIKNITCTAESTTFDVDIANDLLSLNKSVQNFYISLIFNDPLTNTQAIDKKKIALVDYKYLLTAAYSEAFIANKPYNFTFYLKNFDGTPGPSGIRIEYTLNVYFIDRKTIFMRDKNYLTTNAIGAASGTIDFGAIDQETILFISVASTSNLSRIASFAATRVRPDVKAAFVLQLLNENIPSYTDEVHIKAKVNEDIDAINYFIIAKTVLLQSNKIDFKPNQREVEFSILPDYRYTPEMSIYAYYFKSQNNDFQSTSLAVKFKSELPNYLTLNIAGADDANNKQAKPGEEFTLVIDSKPDSYVYLSAIDQRVLLLAKGHNFSESEVLESFTTYGRASGFTGRDYRENAYGTDLHFFTNLNRRPFQISEAFSRPRADSKSSQSDGPENFVATVPDSITTYLVQGVSMNQNDGIGLQNKECSITPFLDFFISMDLPFSVKRGETLVQGFTVFNYLRGTQNVRITINKDSKFDFINPTKYGWSITNTNIFKTVKFDPKKSLRFEFAIRPNTLGFVNMVITAKGTLAGDKIDKKLRVIPQGVPRSITSSVFYALNEHQIHEKVTLKCEIPSTAYSDTTEISSTVVGEILGIVLNNLERLIQFPCGCGEQTLIGFVPDVAVYMYLITTNRLTESLKVKLNQFLLDGYQNELNFQRTDGSFSAFGNYDPSGSTWLTSYAIYSFYLAKNFINIDKNVIIKGLNFIISQQNADGSFKEPGQIIHKDMQSNSANGIAMTAYITMVLSTLAHDYQNAVASRDLAIKYLESHINSTTAIYDLSILAYALSLSNSSQSLNAFTKFRALSTETSTEIFWKTPAPANPNQYYTVLTRSIDIEVTSYGLLTFITRNIALNSTIKILKYLISASNNYGGYSSSQDTVTALLAISSFAQAFKINVTNIDLTLKPNVGSSYHVTVNNQNALTLQTTVLDSHTRQLSIESTQQSSGIAIISLVCNFYEDSTMIKPDFRVNVTIRKLCSSLMSADICFSYIPNGFSNMAIMEVRLPSSFIYKPSNMDMSGEVSKVQSFESGTIIVYYINRITNDGGCINLNAYRNCQVFDIKPGTIKINDYYDTSKEGSALLNVKIDENIPKCTLIR